MRGEHQEFCEKGNDMLGIIPACAGSTASLTFAKLLKEDHPRMRGEHPPPPRTLSLNAQSSPHARGAPLENVLVVVAIGIIPACAGSTTARRCPACATWDHPRMRGEHLKITSAKWLIVGSSPHARGALIDHKDRLLVVGIIPACAGSTLIERASHARMRDHPRMRGEHMGYKYIGKLSQGSSPHARGALPLLSKRKKHQRIIPACAGSTPLVPYLAVDVGDHPRMRGEHGLFLFVATAAAGSSPHARGARLDVLLELRDEGIIPACAGSTELLPRERAGGCGSSPHARGARRHDDGRESGLVDHPRMRGEHTI